MVEGEGVGGGVRREGVEWDEEECKRGRGRRGGGEGGEEREGRRGRGGEGGEEREGRRGRGGEGGEEREGEVREGRRGKGGEGGDEGGNMGCYKTIQQGLKGHTHLHGGHADQLVSVVEKARQYVKYGCP